MGCVALRGASQLLFFREFLAHYESLTRSLIRTATMGMLLIWYFVVFEWAFCGGMYEATCVSQPYHQVGCHAPGAHMYGWRDGTQTSGE